MFRIKICGVTNPRDAAHLASTGADAIGLNFYPASKRYLTPTAAEWIASALPPTVAKVGLFVNAEATDIQALVKRLSLDLIQLHGDESPEFVAGLGQLKVLKAFPAKPGFADQVLRYVGDCERLGTPLQGVLIDAFQPGAYGGTGSTADWESVRHVRVSLGSSPLILAGGLTPSNVAEAIAAVRPFGVDTASGVESAPGQKDAALVQAFVSAAQNAFAGVH